MGGVGHGIPDGLDGDRLTLLPTPTANDAKNAMASPSQWDRNSPQLAVHAEVLDGHTREARGGGLHPVWVEWVMGFPLEWTDTANVWPTPCA